MTAAGSASPRRLAWPLRRWPTIAGIVFAAGLAVAFSIGFSETGQMAQVLTAAGLVYLGAAALGSRAAAWPLFAVTFVLIGVGFVVPGFDPFWAMVGIAVALLIYGLFRGALRPPWGMPLQAGAMVLIVALAIAVALLGPPWAGVLVGVGLLAHAAWDVYHHRTQRVVASTMAEFCAALDTILGLSVIALSLIG